MRRQFCGPLTLLSAHFQIECRLLTQWDDGFLLAVGAFNFHSLKAGPTHSIVFSLSNPVVTAVVALHLHRFYD